MKVKRGQVTVFMIIGIVIIFMLFVLMYFRNVQIEKISKETEGILGLDVNNVKNFVDSCVREVSEEAIQFLGWQGGRLVLQPDSLVTYYSIISYAYDEGQNNLPTMSKMEDEISLYVDLGLDSCLNNFTSFSGYDVSTLDINTTTIIREDSVLVKTYYPIIIKIGDSSTKISDFSAVIPVRLGYLYNLLKVIVEKHQEDPGWIPVSFISDLDPTIKLYPYNETIMVYELVDNESLIDNKPYQFLFTNRFKIRNFEEQYE